MKLRMDINFLLSLQGRYLDPDDWSLFWHGHDIHEARLGSGVQWDAAYWHIIAERITGCIDSQLL